MLHPTHARHFHEHRLLPQRALWVIIFFASSFLRSCARGSTCKSWKLDWSLLSFSSCPSRRRSFFSSQPSLYSTRPSSPFAYQSSSLPLVPSACAPFISPLAGDDVIGRRSRRQRLFERARVRERARETESLLWTLFIANFLRDIESTRYAIALLNMS